jgi:hypothetical protein
MTEQPDLFDTTTLHGSTFRQQERNQMGLKQGGKLRDEGIAIVESNNAEWVAWARTTAMMFCLRHGSVHIDDIREEADLGGYLPDSSNAWGAIFRGGQWEKTGEYRQSRFASNHGHASPVWKIKN